MNPECLICALELPLAMRCFGAVSLLVMPPGPARYRPFGGVPRARSRRGLEGLKGPSHAHSFLEARAAPWEWVCPRCGLEGPVAGTSPNIFRRFPFPLRDKLKLS